MALAIARNISGNYVEYFSVSSGKLGLCFIPGPVLGALKTKAFDFSPPVLNCVQPWPSSDTDLDLEHTQT